VYRDQRIGVVIRAYNEERQIEMVLRTLPEFVDSIIVVDDCSTDATAARCEALKPAFGDRLTVIRHERNTGVGGATVTGLRDALTKNLDAVVVIDGDGQMDPADMPAILEPLVSGKADFVKGNRLFSGRAWQKTPKVRYLGNAMLSLLTKVASGYWHVADSQAGYTAISKTALASIDLNRLHPRFAYENSMLIQLNIGSWRVQDVHLEPRYGIGEKSSMRILKVIPDISGELVRGFMSRMFEKYVIRDFHPLVFFYAIGTILVIFGVALGLLEVYHRIVNGVVASASVVLVALLIISGLQLLLFAMWFDMEYNRNSR
jgi:glycosyltransferase involved in cell wall biosynthesis